jgi:hypothetical protein
MQHQSMICVDSNPIFRIMNEKRNPPQETNFKRQLIFGRRTTFFSLHAKTKISGIKPLGMPTIFPNLIKLHKLPKTNF